MVELDPESELGQIMLRKIPDSRIVRRDDGEVQFRVPPTCRLQIPLDGKHSLKHTISAISRLAGRLQQIYTDPEYSSNRAMHYAKCAVQEVNIDLKQTTKSRKPE